MQDLLNAAAPQAHIFPMGSSRIEMQFMDDSSAPPSPRGEVISPVVERGLGLLLQAHHYADELGRDVWDLAIEIACLRDEGLTSTDLRWLVCKGYVEHAREVTFPGENGREFRPTGDLTFTKRSCFILTRAGVAAARTRREAVPGEPPREASDGDSAAAEHDASQRPSWDRDCHELRVGDTIVKSFKLPSPNQETILVAFEEEGWPPRIDDPLPPTPDSSPKQRLHDTIKSLNRNQKQNLIRFMGDGTGQGIRWVLVRPGGPHLPRRRIETASSGA